MDKSDAGSVQLTKDNLSPVAAPEVKPEHGDAVMSFSGLSGFLALRDMDGTNEMGSRAAKPGLSKDTPRPWMRMPWYRRVWLVPYLWVLVLVDYAGRVLLGLRWLVRQWVKQRPGALVQAAESVLWPLVFIALSFQANPDNPFFVNDGFAWPWLSVWLIAMRYGAASGVASGMVLLGAWYFLRTGQPFPRLYFLGGAIVTLLAGEFGSLWGARATKQREVMRYLDEKIERITRRLYLLKLSHDELEYEMVERPSTLRDALSELQGKLAMATKRGDRLPGAQLVMEFLAAHGQIESGGIYEYLDGPRPVMQRVGKVGDATDLKPGDPMVRRAIESGQSVHLLQQLTELSLGEQVMAVCPMFDAHQEPLGVVAIHRLPFMAFNADNLRNIGVMVDAYAEFVRLRQLASPLLRQWPHAPDSLVHEFAWLSRMQSRHGIDSGCLIWRASGTDADNMLDAVRGIHSNGNLAWPLGVGDRRAVVCLVPFVSVKRLGAHQQLVRESIARRLGGAAQIAALQCTVLKMHDPNAWLHLRDELGDAP